MHIPDGFLNNGSAAGLAGAVAVAVSFALQKVRQSFLEKVPVLKAKWATFPHVDGGSEMSFRSRYGRKGAFNGESHLAPERDPQTRALYSPKSPLRMVTSMLEHLTDLLSHLTELAIQEGGGGKMKLQKASECLANVTMLVQTFTSSENDATPQ